MSRTNRLKERIRRSLRTAYPSVNDRKYNDEEWQQMDKRFAKLRTLRQVSTLLMVLALPFLYHYALYELYIYEYKSSVKYPDEFFPTNSGIFWVPSIILSFFLLYILNPILFKKLAGPEYQDFVQYNNILDGYDYLKMADSRKKLLYFPMLLTVINVLTTKLITTPDDIYYQRTLDITSHSHKFTEIRNVIFFEYTMDKQRNKTPNAHTIIYFTNDDEFNITSYFGSPKNEYPFITLLISKGIKIDSMEAEELLEIYNPVRGWLHSNARP